MNALTSHARPAYLPLAGFNEEAISAYLKSGGAELTQIGTGQLGGEIALMPLQHGAFRRIHFTLDIRFASTLQPGFVNLVLCQDSPSETKVLGTPVGPRHLLVIGEDAFTDARLGAGITWLEYRVPRQFLAALSGFADRDSLPRGKVSHSILSGTDYDQLNDTLVAFNALAREKPHLFLDASWRRNADRALAEAFEKAVGSNSHFADAGQDLKCSRIVRSVDEYLTASDEPVNSVSELCGQLRIGRRTLERAFLDVVGVAPKSYLQLRALKQARRALLDPDRPDLSVTNVAMQLGFWHLGRFAYFYRSLFGEMPSDTQRRTRSLKARV